MKMVRSALIHPNQAVDTYMCRVSLYSYDISDASAALVHPHSGSSHHSFMYVLKKKTSTTRAAAVYDRNENATRPSHAQSTCVQYVPVLFCGQNNSGDLMDYL